MIKTVAPGLLAVLLAVPTAQADDRPLSTRLQKLATSFTCMETVSVESDDGSKIDKVTTGIYEYLLVRPRRSRDVPYIFGERRSPKPKRSPWKRVAQPVPLTWLALEDPDPRMFRVTGSCGDDQPQACNEFSGTLEFLDGLDPREWQGKAWMDERARLRRIEATPVNQGDRANRIATRPPPGAVPGGTAAPGRLEGPSFRIDGTVEDVRCEIEFAELIPGAVLPVRSTCHIEKVTTRGKVKNRWSLVREFTSCRKFGVETQEEVETPAP